MSGVTSSAVRRRRRRRRRGRWQGTGPTAASHHYMPPYLYIILYNVYRIYSRKLSQIKTFVNRQNYRILRRKFC